MGKELRDLHFALLDEPEGGFEARPGA